MSDFLSALGLVFVIEGVLYGLFPDAIRRFGRQVDAMPDPALRGFGVGAVALGVAIVWLIRG